MILDLMKKWKLIKQECWNLDFCFNYCLNFWCIPLIYFSACFPGNGRFKWTVEIILQLNISNLKKRKRVHSCTYAAQICPWHFSLLYILLEKPVKILINKAIIRKINLFSQTNLNVFHKYITTQNRYYPKIKEYI